MKNPLRFVNWWRVDVVSSFLCLVVMYSSAIGVLASLVVLTFDSDISLLILGISAACLLLGGILMGVCEIAARLDIKYGSKAV